MPNMTPLECGVDLSLLEAFLHPILVLRWRRALTSMTSILAIVRGHSGRYRRHESILHDEEILTLCLGMA